MDTKKSIDRMAELSSDIRNSTLKKLEEVPNGFINWRLNNLAMSFADIVQHLIHVDDLFFTIATTNKKKFKWTLGTEEPHLNIDKLTYGSMLNKLKEYQLKRHSIITSFKNGELNVEISNENGQKMSLWSYIMHNLIAHEVYHRGQIGAYLKVLKGESSNF